MVFKLINESKSAFLTMAIEIYLKKEKNPETTLANTKFLEIRKFSEISHSRLFFLPVEKYGTMEINKKPKQSPLPSRRNEIGSFLPQDLY